MVNEDSFITVIVLEFLSLNAPPPPPPHFRTLLLRIAILPSLCLMYRFRTINGSIT